MSDPIRAKLENRLAELKREYETGQNQLAALEARAEELRATMLRISGAIQVLEEELGEELPATVTPEPAIKSA